MDLTNNLYQTSIEYLVENAMNIVPDPLITGEFSRQDILDDYVSPTPQPLVMIFHAITECKLYHGVLAIGITSFEGGFHLHRFMEDGGLHTLDAADIVNMNKGDFEEPDVDEKESLYVNDENGVKLLPCYYLMRHFWLAGISKFLIIPQPTGFVVAVKDPESENLWVPALVDRPLEEYAVPNINDPS